MDSGMCTIKREVDDAGELMTPLSVPLKVEPDFDRISNDSEEKFEEEKFETTDNPEDTVSSEYALKKEKDEEEAMKEPFFIPISAECDFEGSLEDIEAYDMEENAEASQKPEDMDSGMCIIKTEVDDVEELTEPLFVPIKFEPDFDRILEESAVEKNFEYTENVEEMASSEYAVKKNTYQGEVSKECPFVSLKAEPSFEGALEETIMKENFEESEITKGDFITPNHEPSVPLVGPAASVAFSVPEISRSSTRRRKQKLLLRNISAEDFWKENKQPPISLSTASGMVGMNSQENFWRSSISSSKNMLPPSYEFQNEPAVPLCSTADDSVGQEEVADVDLSKGHYEQQMAGEEPMEHSDEGEEGNRPHDKDPHCRREPLLSDSSKSSSCIKRFMCSLCGNCFKAKASLIMHTRIHTGDRPHKCTQCGKSFTQRCNLIAHMRLHTGERPYKCSQCGKSFAWSRSLSIHMFRHTRELPFPCYQCGKCFSESGTLAEHLRLQCGKSFWDNSSLENHMLVHDKPFKCPHCNLSFTQSSTLSEHVRMHTEERPYSCSKCGNSYSLKRHLTEHMRHHPTERPFKCSHCNLSFTQSNTLSEHVRIHTGERPYSCSTCGERFISLSHLIYHESRLHGASSASS